VHCQRCPLTPAGASAWAQGELDSALLTLQKLTGDAGELQAAAMKMEAELAEASAIVAQYHALVSAWATAARLPRSWPLPCRLPLVMLPVQHSLVGSSCT
jgi:hypothetical protein